jgi:hypothetical protein
MIQRIQSVYLLVVAILFGVLLCTPIMEMIHDGHFFILNYKGIIGESGVVLQQTYLLTALEIIIPVLALVTIFLYKKRMLQIRLTIINTVLMIGFYPLLFVYLYVANKVMPMDFALKMTVVFPLVSAILSYLAIRAIGKDEVLVRAADRIR